MISKPLNNKLFKDAVNDHIAQKFLDDDQLLALEQLQTNTQEPVTKWSQLHHGSYAAAIALIVIVGTLFSFQVSNIPQEIAQEVVKNHLRMKPLDINSNKLEEVSEYFTMLDFLPLKSKEYNRTNPLLLGGRYCSIKGITAAQLRYQNTEGKLETLYQVPYDSNIFSDLPKLEEGEPPITLFERGLEVTIWVEKGLLMVASKPPL